MFLVVKLLYLEEHWLNELNNINNVKIHITCIVFNDLVRKIMISSINRLHYRIMFLFLLSNSSLFLLCSIADVD